MHLSNIFNLFHPRDILFVHPIDSSNLHRLHDILNFFYQNLFYKHGTEITSKLDPCIQILTGLSNNQL